MKILVGFLRIFVGIFFIISGLVKLVDPVGFSFKLQDYFAPEVLNLEFLIPFSLGLSVFVLVFEVMLGIMLILGYAKKFTLWSLLLMIVFFTFLTLYSAVTGAVTDCGCFGSALQIDPITSFWKDVVLLVMILILFFGRKYIQPFFATSIRRIAVFVSLGLCLWLAYHVLIHLPIIDFRPYHIGANIQEGMSVPEDAPPPIIEYQWKYEIDGKERIIANTTGQDPKPEGGTRLGVETEFLREPYEPPIHDFSIERDDEDFTMQFLEEEHLIVVIAYNLDVTEEEGYENIKNVTNEALRKGYGVIGLSASSTEETETLAKKYGLNFKFYYCDMTTLKTIVRSNPGILELQKGTILQKFSWNDAMDMTFETLEGAMPNLDFDLKQQLDSIAVLDQKFRNESYGEHWKEQQQIDSTNLVWIEEVFKTKGYPGESLVGSPANRVAWLVVQHSDKISEYFPIIKKAAEEGELPLAYAATMEDRYLMEKGEPQWYGTQGMTFNLNSGEVVDIIWPIKDLEEVNARRQKAGFTTTVEENAKQLYGPDFEFSNYTLEEVELLKNK
ncbi:MAG: BT_3928 family protein [Bacteroidota bacterium]